MDITKQSLSKKEKSLKFNSDSNNNRRSVKKPDDSLYSSLIYSLKLAIKVLGMKVIFSIIKNPSILSKFSSIKGLSGVFFSESNIRTTAFVSLLPLLRDILSKLASYCLGYRSQSMRYLALFVSAIASISIEQSSNILTFIVMTIFVRLGYVFIQTCLGTHLWKERPSRLVYLSGFNICVLLYLFVHFTNRGFLAITKPTEKLFQLLPEELNEYDKVLEMTKLFEY